MAGRIDRTTKERLQTVGKWRAFLDRRDELKTQGHSPNDARTMALAEVLAECDDSNDSSAKLLTDDSMPLAPADLAGKMAAEPEVTRWVARNMNNPAPNPADCPDPFGWTLLRMCRESPAFAMMFVKDIWVKLLVQQAKQPDADRADGKIDGTPTLKLIEQIRAMRDRANSGQA